MDVKGYALVIWLLMGTVWATAATSTEQFEKLQESIVAFNKAKAEKAATAENPTAPSRSSYVVTNIYPMGSVKRALEKSDINALQEDIPRIKAAFPNEEIGKLCDSLLDTAQKEVADRNRALLEKAEVTSKKAGEIALAAKEPKELDALILECSRLKKRSDKYAWTDAIGTINSTYEQAERFLCLWQDYLMHRNNGNKKEALRILKEITSGGTYSSFVPRSELLTRQSQATEPDALPENVPSLTGKTLADLDSLKKTIDAMHFKDPTAGYITENYQAINGILHARNQFESGMVSEALDFCVHPKIYGSFNGLIVEVSPLRDELLRKILPVYLNIAKDYPAQDKEKPNDYLQRVLKSAREKGDWRLTWKTLETYRNVAFSNDNLRIPGWLNTDIQGCAAYLIAQNQEKAGLYTDAVLSYRKIFSVTGENIPSKEAEERLNRIKSEHPDAYALAEKSVFAYPVSIPPPTATKSPNDTVPR